MRESDGFRTLVAGVGGLAGRLWLVEEFRDFFIGKSEGAESGFWIDTSETAETFTKRSLGLDPPPVPSLSGGTAPSEALPPGLYVYALTAVRAFFSDVDAVDLPPQVASKSFSGEALFNGMESNPTYFVVKVGGAQGDVYQDGQLVTNIVELPASNQGVALNNVTYSQADQTGIYVYRTEVIETSVGRRRREDVEALQFRVTDFLFRSRPSDGQADTGGTLHFGIDISGRPLMRKDNDRLPAVAAQIAYYNDLVFAACGDELRYSDVRDGSLVQWAFPVSNSVRALGDIVFCAEYRGVLLFGGPQGIWRFTGTDEFNFRRDQICSFGPVSRTAFGVFENGVGFVSQAGLFVTDGVQVQAVSSPFLDGYFAAEVLDATVTRIPDGDEVYCVRFVDAAPKQFLRSKRGGWFIQSGMDATQFATDESVRFVDGLTQGVRTYAFSDYETVEDALPWSWESQVIDFKERGFGEAMKVFKWLEVSSSHSGPGTVFVSVDGVARGQIDFEFREASVRPVRVRLGHRGERLQFTVRGTGRVILRSLRLVAEVRSSRRRQ